MKNKIGFFFGGKKIENAQRPPETCYTSLKRTVLFRARKKTYHSQNEPCRAKSVQ